MTSLRYGHSLQFGVSLTPRHDSADAVVALAQRSERLGYDLVTFQDHPYQPRFLDTWTLLTWVASRTQRIRVGGQAGAGTRASHPDLDRRPPAADATPGRPQGRRLVALARPTGAGCADRREPGHRRGCRRGRAGPTGDPQNPQRVGRVRR